MIPAAQVANGDPLQQSYSGVQQFAAGIGTSRTPIQQTHVYRTLSTKRHEKEQKQQQLVVNRENVTRREHGVEKNQAVSCVI